MLCFSVLGLGLCFLCLLDQLPREALSTTQSGAQVEGTRGRQGWVHSSMASCWPPVPVNVAQPPLVTREGAYCSSSCCKSQFLRSVSRCSKASALAGQCPRS